MKEKTTATVIGSFFLGAAVILILLILWLVPGIRLKPNRYYVVYFHHSLMGLQTGANVEFRGIVVGKVIDTQIVYDPKTKKFITPVIIQTIKREKKVVVDSPTFQQIIKLGLRARINTSSLFAGQTYIDLVLKPKTKPIFYNNTTLYRQIPTMLASAQSKTNISDLISTTNGALSAFKDFLNSDNMKKLIESSSGAMTVGKKLMQQTQRQLPPLLIQAKQTLKQVNGAAYSIKSLTNYLARQPQALISGKKQRRYR